MDYPDSCQDGLGPVGTNRHTFDVVMRAEIPNLPENLFGNNLDGPPETVAILDVIEFCWRHVGEPVTGSYHNFFQHSHLSFNRDLGRSKFRDQINLIFARNGLAYTLTDEGNIERIGPPVLNEELASAQFVTGDSELDRILESARRKFLNPHVEIRREALLELWGAWERLRTTGQGADKKDQIMALLNGTAGTGYPKFRELLEKEALGKL